MEILSFKIAFFLVVEGGKKHTVFFGRKKEYKDIFLFGYSPHHDIITHT